MLKMRVRRVCEPIMISPRGRHRRDTRRFIDFLYVRLSVTPAWTVAVDALIALFISRGVDMHWGCSRDASIQIFKSQGITRIVNGVYEEALAEMDEKI